MKKLIIIFCILLCASPSAWGACTKSGTVYTCTSGSTSAQIQTALSSASSGDTVHLNPGTYAFGNSGIAVTGGASNVTLEGAGIGQTYITGGIHVNSKDNFRITGMDWSVSSSVAVYGITAVMFEGCHDFRFDHNKLQRDSWNDPLSAIHSIADYSTQRESYGLIDNNTFINVRILVWNGWDNHSVVNPYWYQHGDTRGGQYNVYIENNTASVLAGTQGPGGLTCDQDGRVLCNFIDAKHGGGYVARFNTLTNTYFEHHPGGSPYSRGTKNTEIYHNSMTVSGSFTPNFSRPVYLQGSGSGVIFNNTPVGYQGTSVSIDYNPDNESRRTACLAGGDSVDENLAAGSGYACFDQIGVGYDTNLVGDADTHPNQVKIPFYLWSNAQSGTQWSFSDNTGGLLAEIYQDNRDLFEYTASFSNSSGGVGVGTYAQMTSFTPSIVNTGFWVTDRGSWRSGYSNTSGVLYRWTGSAWAIAYTPYTYPHPLVSGSGGDTTAPTVVSASTSINSAGTALTIGFSEIVTIGTGGSGGLTLSASGGAVTATYSSGSGTSSLVYTLSRTIQSGETITRTYTQPVNGIEDYSGNDLLSFSGVSVTNSSTQTPPTLSTKTIALNGTTLTLVFNEIVTTTALSGAGGWTIAPSGGAATLAYASGSGTTNLVYTISRRIMTGETATVSYSGTYVRDATLLNLPTYSNQTVTNSSDSVPALIDNLSPSGVQACTSNPRNVTLSHTTNEAATSRMSLTDVAYSSMSDTFTTTGGTSHSEVKSLACGASYTYYVRTSDAQGNVNTSSATISFSIASPQIAGPGGFRIIGGRLTH